MNAVEGSKVKMDGRNKLGIPANRELARISVIQVMSK